LEIITSIQVNNKVGTNGNGQQEAEIDTEEYTRNVDFEMEDEHKNL
jgi:hypothetical protein